MGSHASIITRYVHQIPIIQLMLWGRKSAKSVHLMRIVKSALMMLVWSVMWGIILIKTKSVNYAQYQLLGAHHALKMVKYVILAIPNNLKKILWIMFVYALKAQFGTLFRKSVFLVQVKYKIVQNVYFTKTLINAQNALLIWTESQVKTEKLVFAIHFILRTIPNNVNFVIHSKNVKSALHQIIAKNVIIPNNGLLIIKESVNVCKIMYKWIINAYFVEF